MEEFVNTVTLFLKENNFNVFPCNEFEIELDLVEWKDTDNWQDFFKIASKEVVTTVYEEIKQFSSIDLQVYQNQKNNDYSEEYNESLDIVISEIQKNLDKIYSATYCWIKNGIIHSISKQAPWYDSISEHIESLEELGESENEKIELEDRKSKDYRTADIPEELSDKTPEELATQYFEYLKTEYPSDSQVDSYSIRQNYWRSLGLSNSGNNKHDILIEKISRIIDKIKDKKEKEMIPELLEKCVNWAIKNEEYKPSQVLVRGFLSESNIELSSSNFRTLHMKIILKLKRKKSGEVF